MKRLLSVYFSFYSKISILLCCFKSNNREARHAIENWKAKMKRDQDYKPIMELIMRQKAAYLRDTTPQEQFEINIKGQVKFEINIKGGHADTAEKIKPIFINFHDSIDAAL